MSYIVESKTFQPTPYTLSLFPSGIKIPRYILEQSEAITQAMLADVAVDNESLDPHYDLNRQFIMDSAAGLSGSVAILGVGNATDIPLEQLASQFDSLTLVELDQTAIINKVKQLPLALQEKCHIVIDDLGGSIAETVQVANEAFRDCNNITTFGQRLAEDLPYVTTRALNLGDNFDFIISSLVTSQLHMASKAYIVKETLTKFGSFDISTQSPYFAKKMEAFASKLKAEHFQMMAQSIKPSGRIYWADTMDYAASALLPNGDISSRGETLVDVAHLNQSTSNFVVNEERQWLWNRPSKNPRKKGTTYTILARNMSLY